MNMTTRRLFAEHTYDLAMIALLRQRNYALLWSSATISALGNWLLVAALPYYVYSTTGSTLASGGAIISTVAPMVILPSIGGIFADRWNRKRVMFWSDWLRGFILLPMLAVHSASTVWIVFVVGFVGSTVGYFAGPFGAASIPQLIGPDNLPAANSGFVVGANVGRIAGPFAAGARSWSQPSPWPSIWCQRSPARSSGWALQRYAGQLPLCRGRRCSNPRFQLPLVAAYSGPTSR